ncbi:MAG TPA: hypothetical protein PL151_20415 [Phycisphaerae bacterium]|nr:hypothetical protein [Phycisphaerae bacterium]HOJ74389.1 hypothetical protein [Phycisphaerae bacterium]HOM52878.1 hypothetical protein [Phycisphaerae bacterium]HPP27138.1 hypothetical protein [Phycisphaerae bacterium]HPU28256.1 hypothetical protein [Phycisphaerae bacterium]
MADCDITPDRDCGCGKHAGCECEHDHVSGSTPARSQRFGWWGAAGRFAGWWVGMSGLVAMVAVCPCCGTQACPNGIVGMGFVGAVMASFLRLRNWFRGSSSTARL